MTKERDPRLQPRAGDILRTPEIIRMVQGTTIQNVTLNAVIRLAEVPHNPNRDWISVPMWKRWARHAEVIHRAE